MLKNSIIPFLKDYLINFLTSPFLLDTNELVHFYWTLMIQHKLLILSHDILDIES